MSTLRLLVCTACLLTTAAAAVAQTSADDFDAALEAYERGHWSDAYRSMSRLADGGHAQAARVALQMRRYGPVLFGQQFEATTLQQQRWAALRACSADGALLAQRTAVAPTAC